MSQRPGTQESWAVSASLDPVRASSSYGSGRAGQGSSRSGGARSVGVPMGPRTVRMRVRRIETGTVLLFSLLAYLGLFVVFQVAVLVVYLVADSAGLLHGLQHAAVTTGFKPLTHLGTTVFEISFFGGLVMVGIATLVNLVVAVVYNLVSDIVGGIAVIVDERDQSRR